MAFKFAFLSPRNWMDMERWTTYLNDHLVPHLDLGGRVLLADVTVAETTTETEVFSATTTAGQLTRGRVVKTRLMGRYSTANATDFFTARLKIGGTTIISIAATAKNVTDAPFDLEFLFTVRSAGATGTVQAFAEAEIDNEGKAADATATTTLDTTVDEAITCTIEWSAATAGNTLTLDQAWTEFVGV